ncbi:MAG TPA: hypothetical protein VGO55_10290 [Allosphingosinicella sp.]|nr:hypothetical protein [Allosphingosinicella sp.]
MALDRFELAQDGAPHLVERPHPEPLLHLGAHLALDPLALLLQQMLALEAWAGAVFARVGALQEQA